MSVYVQTNQISQLTAPVGAGAVTVNAADTGKKLLIPVLGGAGANTIAITLPALAAGLNYTFIAQGTLVSAATIAAPVGNIMCGQIQNNAAGVSTITAKANAANVQFTATAVIGDQVNLYCDGVKWYVQGFSSVAAGLA